MIVPEETRQEILRVYTAEGTDAASELCIRIGLSSRYYSSLAYKRGVSRKKSKPLTPEQKAKMRGIVQKDDSHDYRWKWAIERGPVLAP